MFEYTWAKVHATLNDLPSALLVAAVLFELAGWWLKRETMRAASLWMLWAGVLGGWAAFIAGNQSEASIDHGDAIHAVMERHEDLALYTMIAFSVLLLWKLWRRGQLAGAEAWGARILSLGGLVLLVLTGASGGQAVMDHAAGVTTQDLITELQDRKVKLVPAPDSVQADSTAPPEGGGHTHAPGTPPHRH
jgi:uncharacterized membrane protein